MPTTIYHNDQDVISVRLDWREYFKGFCANHGNDPIVIGNRLLFWDGWMYSAYDFAGPEYRPPEDAKKVRELQLRYWTERLYLLEGESWRLKRLQESMESFQASKDSPLQQVVEFKNAEGKRRTRVEDIDFSVFDGRLEWLEAGVEECRKQIDQLTVKEFENVHV